MSAYLPTKEAIRLARALGLAVMLFALLATPVECLCGDPYPSAHALLEFILAPQTIIMADNMPGMTMLDQMSHQSAQHPGSAEISTVDASAASAPAIDSGAAPTIKENTGHLERTSSYSAIAGLFLLLLITSANRRRSEISLAWRGIRHRPAIPPPRQLLVAA